MTCEHPQIQTWRFKDTGESAQMWSCIACGEKFMPITQAWAESRKDAELWRAVSTSTMDMGNGVELRDCVSTWLCEVRALPVDPI